MPPSPDEKRFDHANVGKLMNGDIARIGLQIEH